MSTERPHPPALPPEVRAALAEAPGAGPSADRLWALLERARPAPSAAPEQVDAAWRDLRAALDGPAAGRAADRPARRRTAWRVRAGVAAGAVGVLVLLAAWLLARPVAVEAPAGERVVAALPDGSTVELAAGTRLTYARFLGRAAERAVQLRGEAFFDVVPSARPFVVTTYDARVEVLGTSFNVRARAGEETVVTLATGRVRVHSRGEAPAEVLLDAAGQTTRVRRAGPPTPPQPDRLDQVLVWREDGFVVRNRPLHYHFAELERRWGIEVRVRPGTPLTDSLSLIHPGPVDPETLLNDICLAAGLRYHATPRGFEVYGEGRGAKDDRQGRGTKDEGR